MISLELIKARLRGAQSRGSEYVTIYHKADGESEERLEFFEDSSDHYTLMRGKAYWKAQGYTPKHVYDLIFVVPDELEEA